MSSPTVYDIASAALLSHVQNRHSMLRGELDRTKRSGAAGTAVEAMHRMMSAMESRQLGDASELAAALLTIPGPGSRGSTATTDAESAPRLPATAARQLLLERRLAKHGYAVQQFSPQTGTRDRNQPTLPGNGHHQSPHRATPGRARAGHRSPSLASIIAPVSMTADGVSSTSNSSDDSPQRHRQHAHGRRRQHWAPTVTDYTSAAPSDGFRTPSNKVRSRGANTLSMYSAAATPSIYSASASRSHRSRSRTPRSRSPTKHGARPRGASASPAVDAMKAILRRSRGAASSRADTRLTSEHGSDSHSSDSSSETSSSSSSFYGAGSFLEAPSHLSSLGGKHHQRNARQQRRPSPSTRNRRHSSIATDASAWAPTSDAPSITTSLTPSRAPTTTTSAVRSARPQPAAAGRSERVANVLARLAAAAAAREKEGATPHRTSPGRGPARSPGRAADPSATTSTTSRSVGTWLEGVGHNPQHTTHRRPDKPSPQRHTPQPRRQLVRSDTVNTWKSVPASTAITYDRTSVGGSSGSDTTGSSTGSSDEESRSGSRVPVSLGQASDLGLSLRDFAVESELPGARGRGRPSLLQLLAQQSRSESRPGGRNGAAGGGASGIPRDLASRVQRAQATLERLQLGQQILKGSQADEPPFNTQERRRQERKAEERRQREEHEMRLIRKDLGLSPGAQQATRGKRASAGDDDGAGSVSSGYDEGSGTVLSELLSAASAGGDGAVRVRRGRAGSASTTTSTATATTTTAMPPSFPGGRRGGRGVQGRGRLASISEAVSASGYGDGSGGSEGRGSSDSGSDSDSPDKIVRRRLAPGQRARLMRSLQELHQERPELLESQTHMRRLRRLLRWLAGLDGAGQGGPDDNPEAQLRRLQEGSVRSGAAGGAGDGRSGPGRVRGATAASLMQAVGPSDSSGGSRDSSPPRRVGDVVGLGGGSSSSSSRSASPGTRLRKQQSAQRRVRMAEQRASQSPGRGTLGGGREGMVRSRGEAGSLGHGRGSGRRAVTSSDGSELLSSVVRSAARGRGGRGVGSEGDGGKVPRRSASKASRGRRAPHSGAESGEDSDGRGARVGANMGRLAQAGNARRDSRRQGGAGGSAGEGDSEQEESELVANERESKEGSEQVAVNSATRSKAAEKGGDQKHIGTRTEDGRRDARGERGLELEEAPTQARPRDKAAGPGQTESLGLRPASEAGSAPTAVEGHSRSGAPATSGPLAAPAPAAPPPFLRSVDAQTSAIRDLKMQLLALEQQLLSVAGPEDRADGDGTGGFPEGAGEGQVAELYGAAGRRGIRRLVGASSLPSEGEASLASSISSTGAGAQPSGSGLCGWEGGHGQVPAEARQWTGDVDGNVGREGKERLGSAVTASALGERLGELRDAFAQRRGAKKDREGGAQHQQPLKASGSVGLRHLEPQQEQGGEMQSQGQGGAGDVGLDQVGSGGTAAGQGSPLATAAVGGAGSPHESDVHELPVLSSTDKGRVRTAQPGQGLAGVIEAATDGAHTPMPTGRVLEPLMGEAAGPGTAGGSELGMGSEEGGFGSPVGGDGAPATGAQRPHTDDKPGTIADTGAGAGAVAGAGGFLAPGDAAQALGAAAGLAQLEKGDGLDGGPSAPAGASAGAGAAGGRGVPAPGATALLLAQLEAGGRLDGGLSAVAGAGFGGVLAPGAAALLPAQLEEGGGLDGGPSAVAGAGVRSVLAPALLPAKLEAGGGLDGGRSALVGAGAGDVLAHGAAALLLAQLEEDREALLDRCLELEEQLQTRTQELQRRFAGVRTVGDGRGGGSGSFPDHTSAAPGTSAGARSSSSSMGGRVEGQGQQGEERSALAARCEDLQRQLATVHGEVDSLMGRTHAMQSAVADGASGLRGRLSDLEDRLAALEAENAALRRAAAGADEMYNRAADLAAQLSLLQDHVDLLTLDKRELQVELELAQMAAAGDASGSGSDSLHKQYLQEQLQAMSSQMAELLRDRAMLEQQARTLHQQVAAQEQQQQGGKLAGPTAAAAAALAREQQTPATVARGRPPGVAASKQGGPAAVVPPSASGPRAQSSSAAATAVPAPQGTRRTTHHPPAHFDQPHRQQQQQLKQQQHLPDDRGMGGGGVVTAQRQSNETGHYGHGGGGGDSVGGGHEDGVPESEVRALFLGRIAQLQRRVRQLHAENDDLALQAKPSPTAAAGVSRLHGQVHELGQQLDAERRVRSHLNDLQVRAVGADSATRQATPTRRREADPRFDDAGTLSRGPSLASLVHQTHTTSAQLEVRARVEALEQPATRPGPRGTGGTAVHSSAAMPVIEVDVSVMPLVHSSAALQRRGQAQVQGGQSSQPGSAPGGRAAAAQLWASAQASGGEEGGLRSEQRRSGAGARAATAPYAEAGEGGATGLRARAAGLLV